MIKRPLGAPGPSVELWPGALRPGLRQGPQISEVMFFSHVRTPKFITSLNRTQDESQGPNCCCDAT